MFKFPLDDNDDRFPEVKFLGRGLYVKPEPRRTVPKAIARTKGKLIVVNRTEQMVRTYENGRLVHLCECALGNMMKSTPVSCKFSVTDKDEDHVSDIYDVPMHWAVFFTTEGHALHKYHGDTSEAAWQQMRRQQYFRGSAGCVRLREADAKKIFEWAPRYKTKVWVVDRLLPGGECTDTQQWLDLLLGWLGKKILPEP